MVFSDGQIRYFSWRHGVGWSCGKDIWHVESCYLQYSMWKDFRSVLCICRWVENASLFSNIKWDLVGLIVCKLVCRFYFLHSNGCTGDARSCINLFTDVHNRNIIGPRCLYLLIHHSGSSFGMFKKQKNHTSSDWVDWRKDWSDTFNITNWYCSCSLVKWMFTRLMFLF